MRVGSGFLLIFIYESLQLATEGGRENTQASSFWPCLLLLCFPHKAAAYQCSTPRVQGLPIRNANGVSLKAQGRGDLGREAALASG